MNVLKVGFWTKPGRRSAQPIDIALKLFIGGNSVIAHKFCSFQQVADHLSCTMQDVHRLVMEDHALKPVLLSPRGEQTHFHLGALQPTGLYREYIVSETGAVTVTSGRTVGNLRVPFSELVKLLQEQPEIATNTASLFADEALVSNDQAQAEAVALAESYAQAEAVALAESYARAEAEALAESYALAADRLKDKPLVVEEPPQQRRARWLEIFDEESAVKKCGAVFRTATKVGFGRSYVGKQIRIAEQERGGRATQPLGPWFALSKNGFHQRT